MDAAAYVGTTDFFEGLDQKQREVLYSLFTQREYAPGEYVFREKEEGDELFIVESGLVVIKRWITEGNIEKMLLTAEPGTVFGELSFMDRGGRNAAAVSETQSVVRVISRADFDAFAQKDPKAANLVLSNLLGIVVDRLRGTTNAYFDAVQYNLQVSGSQQLNFHHLIASSMTVRITLAAGQQVTGTILQVEKSDAGHEVIVRDPEHNLLMIPYHAITTIVFDVPEPKATGG